MRRFQLTILALVVGIISAAGLAAQSSVIPAGHAATEGISSTSYPWNYNNMRVQYCYDTTHFAGHTGPIIINELHWRADGGTITWAGGTHTGVTIEMSSSPLDQAVQTTTFATNHGLDRAKVFSGTVTVLPNSSIATPRTGYYVKVKLSTPFLYDPTAGKDLLIDIATTAKSGTTHYLDCATTGCLTSRMYAFTSTATTGSIQQNVGPVVQMVYTPAKGLYANFDATPTVGAAPMKVQFTDKTFTSAPGGVTSWAWDLNGDNKVDSTLKNPMFVYATQNKTVTYDVTLTVTDGTNPKSTLTKKAFITVDPPPTANFSATPTLGSSPLLVSFTDTSIAASSWKWDFNNDTVVDATVQNPKFVYGKPGVYSVSLEVANIGGKHKVTKANFITAVGGTSNKNSPEILQYQFNEVRTTKVFNSAANTVAPPTGTASPAIWQGDTGRYGFQGNEKGFGCLKAGTSAYVASGWPLDVKGSYTIEWWMRRSSSATGVVFGYVWGGGSGSSFRCFIGGAASNGILVRGQGTMGDYNSTLNAQGVAGKWQHFALVVDDAKGVATWYIDGIADTTTKTWAPNTFSVKEGTGFNVGHHTGSAITANFDFDDFRFYSHARTAAQVKADMGHEVATSGTFDVGCGSAKIGGDTVPVPLTIPPYGVTIEGAPATAPGLLLLGFKATKLMNTIPLPFDISFALGAGCNLHTDITISFPFTTDAGGNGKVILPLPPGTEGAHLYGQAIIAGTKMSVTPGLDINIQK